MPIGSEGTVVRRSTHGLVARDAALVAKDRDIAMLAHDLRNPLTTITASVELLLKLDVRFRSARGSNRASR